MAFTTQQKQALKTVIQADPTANQALIDGNLTGVADFVNSVASPTFWVWRTAVSRSEIYNLTSPDGSVWNWTTYKNQGATEQNAWTQMFMGDQADFSKPNLRAGIAAIFTGSAQANAQRDHCLSMGRRAATVAEKALATGTGSAVAPATMAFEGVVPYTEFQDPFYTQA